MSTLNKSVRLARLKTATLALATTAALGVPMMASAISTTYSSDPTDYTFARNIFANAANTVATPLALTINAIDSDNTTGRSTGFGVRITLDKGKFETSTVALAPAIGTALPPSDTAFPWTVSQDAATGDETNSVTFAVVPPNDGDDYGMTTGPILTFAAGNIVLDNLTALGVAGTRVRATIQTFDSNTSANLTNTTVDLLVSVEGVVIGYDTSSTGSTAGDVNSAARIDVGATDAYDAKTSYSPNGEIASETQTELFNAGAIDYSVRGLATGFVGNNNNGGDFGYAPLLDTFTTVVTGLDFAPFADGSAGYTYLSSNSDCSDEDVYGTVDETTATFTYTLAGAGLGGDATGGTAYVCFNTDGTTVIEQQGITASTTVNLNDANVLDPLAPYNGTLLPMLYNGSIVKVASINPAGNTTAESFLRISNPYGSGGLVTISGTDDAGNAGDSDITFTLDAGESIQINSADLENGNADKGLTGAWGDGSGKWRAVVTAEFGWLRVASLNRNSTDGTVTNLTDYDTQDEQLSRIYDIGPADVPLNQGSDPQY